MNPYSNRPRYYHFSNLIISSMRDDIIFETVEEIKKIFWTEKGWYFIPLSVKPISENNKVLIFKLTYLYLPKKKDKHTGAIAYRYIAYYKKENFWKILHKQK